MKKLLFLVVILFAANTMYAQQGSMYVGGGIMFYNDDWKVAPEAGYWLSDELQLGAVLSFSGTDNSNTIAPHVYLRKWWSVGEKFGLYIGANGRLVNSHVDALDGGGSDTSDTYFDAFLDAGFALSVAPRWGMVGRVATVGLIQEDFKFELEMSPQSMFNVGIYYTFKE
ncbi:MULTISPECIES: outer membrane beta-barrel protein [Reichenbachiella]|uniref:Outer membrane protein beta-barrel domain-containing protein n=1 Tax=Reichenbachiella agariperforans TaxID=156994 RepID=A0A1M6NJK3_REIAG|nr:MULTISPECIES: outer membrane beta-barrel protein [Reichenbachiella]MBU2915903.1 outer membrane beta-barrel protein [Reichenbachiella agariperforans]RJE71840.1 hypothetical protein BGP76_07060 [Reichenbachiella sp. MSK19-1]SHJ95921.1 Outer membrane protein beta-barrel domain-containing protein [Reichenbachiella agariperforans]